METCLEGYLRTINGYRSLIPNKHPVTRKGLSIVLAGPEKAYIKDCLIRAEEIPLKYLFLTGEKGYFMARMVGGGALGPPAGTLR
jgi:hypothetical protein